MTHWIPGSCEDEERLGKDAEMVACASTMRNDDEARCEFGTDSAAVVLEAICTTGLSIRRRRHSEMTIGPLVSSADGAALGRARHLPVADPDWRIQPKDNPSLEDETVKKSAKRAFNGEPSRMPLLNRKAAAYAFGVSASLLEKLASRGTGPRYYRVVQSKRAAAAYRIEDLEEFFASRAGRSVQSCSQLP